MTDFIDFEIEDAPQCVNFVTDDINSEDIHVTDNKKHKYDEEYNFNTSSYYVAMRHSKMDPITYDQNCEHFFEFNKMWNPYTGERKGNDPHGPLCFNPCNLIKFYHTRRLVGLWNNGTSDNNGVYQGYYDENVGAGMDIEINGRGKFPERYLFRLPVFDCYLTEDHNNNFITMGPKLTDDEIELIDKLASKFDNTPLSYEKLHGNTRPMLCDIKKLYDLSINNEKTENIEEHNKKNRLAVEQLKKL